MARLVPRLPDLTASASAPRWLARRAGGWQRRLGRLAPGQMLTATATIAALSIVVKSGTALRELLVAWYFGAGDAVDAYVIAYTLPYFLITVLGGSLPSVLIPAYVRVRRQLGIGVGEDVLSSAIAATSFVLLPVVLALMAGARAYLPLLGGGFSPEKLGLTSDLALLLTPTLLTSTLAAVLAAALNAHGRFVVPALSPLVTTAVAIASLVAFAPAAGIRALAVGTLAGTVLEACVLLIVLGREGIALRVPTADVRPHLRDLARLSAHALAGSALMAGTLLVDQAIAALLQPGSVATLNYAARIVTLPLGLTAAALGTVALPYFSHAVSAHDWDDVERTLSRYLRLTFAFGVPAALALALLADPLVRLLLSHGSFSVEDVPAVGRATAALAVQIPFYTGVILLMRIGAALRLNLAIAWISGVNLAVNVVLDVWLASLLGVAGVALSTSLVYVCSFALLLWVVRRELVSVRSSPPGPTWASRS